MYLLNSLACLTVYRFGDTTSWTLGVLAKFMPNITLNQVLLTS